MKRKKKIFTEYVKNKKKQIFHYRHEVFTKIAYRFPFFLPDRYCFVLTNLCNLRCKNCYQEKRYKEDSLNKKQWIDLARQLPSYARVTLVGGEPLVFPGFKDVFEYVAERFSCNLITNGILLNEEIIDLLLSYPKFKVLAVSLDGLKQNTMDVRRISEKQWERLEKMLNYFVNKRDKLGSDCVLEIKTLVVDENSETLYELHKYCVKTLRCDHHTFQFLKGSPLQHSDNMYDFSDIFKKSSAHVYKKFDVIKEQLEKIRDYNKKHNKFAFLHPKIGSLVSNRLLPDIDFINVDLHNKDIYKACKFPWSSVHINYDGNIFPCLAVSIGNIKEKSLKEIMKGEEYRRFLKAIKKHGTVEACNRCGWLRPKRK